VRSPRASSPGIWLVITKMEQHANLMWSVDGIGIIHEDHASREYFSPFEGEAARECFPVVAPSIRRPALKARSYKLELWPGAYLNRLSHARTFGDGCLCHLSRHIRVSANEWILLSIDLNSPALTTVWTSCLTRKHRNKPKMSGAPEIHRGLTLHEDSSPLAEVFGDDD
jgi:hypothetical protein